MPDYEVADSTLKKCIDQTPYDPDQLELVLRVGINGSMPDVLVNAPARLKQLKTLFPDLPGFVPDLEEPTITMNNPNFVGIGMHEGHIVYSDDLIKPTLWTNGIFNCVGIAVFDSTTAATSAGVSKRRGQAGLFHFNCLDSNQMLVDFLKEFDPTTCSVHLTSAYYEADLLRVIQVLQQLGFIIDGCNVPDQFLADAPDPESRSISTYRYIDKDRIHKNYMNSLLAFGHTNSISLFLDSATGKLATNFYRPHPKIASAQISSNQPPVANVKTPVSFYPFVTMSGKAPQSWVLGIESSSTTIPSYNGNVWCYEGGSIFTAIISTEDQGLINALKKGLPGKTDTQYQCSKTTRQFNLDGMVEILAAIEVISKINPLPEPILKLLKDRVSMTSNLNSNIVTTEHAQSNNVAITPSYRSQIFKGGTARIDEDPVRDWSLEVGLGSFTATVNFFTIMYYKGELTARVSSGNTEVIAKFKEAFPTVRDSQFQLVPEVREFELNGIKDIMAALSIAHGAESLPEQLAEQLKQNLTNTTEGKDYFSSTRFGFS